MTTLQEVHAGVVRCLRCRRVLQEGAVRVSASYGDRCWRGIAAAVGSLQASVNMSARRAGQALQEGWYQLTPIPGLYVIRSRTTESLWQVDKYSCSCPGGSAGRLCYHRVGVIVLTAE